MFGKKHHDEEAPKEQERKRDAKDGEVAGPSYYRVRVFLTAHPELAAPDHVVQALDEKRAEMVAAEELGITFVDRTVNTVEIRPATKEEYEEAQRKLGRPV